MCDLDDDEAYQEYLLQEHDKDMEMWALVFALSFRELPYIFFGRRFHPTSITCFYFHGVDMIC